MKAKSKGPLGAVPHIELFCVVCWQAYGPLFGRPGVVACCQHCPPLVRQMMKESSS